MREAKSGNRSTADIEGIGSQHSQEYPHTRSSEWVATSFVRKRPQTLGDGAQANRISSYRIENTVIFPMAIFQCTHQWTRRLGVCGVISMSMGLIRVSKEHISNVYRSVTFSGRKGGTVSEPEEAASPRATSTLAARPRSGRGGQLLSLMLDLDQRMVAAAPGRRYGNRPPCIAR